MEVLAKAEDSTVEFVTDTLIGVLKHEYTSNERASEMSIRLSEQNQYACNTTSQVPFCHHEK